MQISYLLADDDSYLLYGAVELLEGHLSLVVDVEELEALGQESLFPLVGRTLLHQLGLHLRLKARGKSKDNER